MHFQTLSTSEALGTLATMIWLLNPEIMPVVALVRSQASVAKHVSLQIATPREALRALAAAERLLTGVRSHVPLQVVGLCETPRAQFALESLPVVVVAPSVNVVLFRMMASCGRQRIFTAIRLVFIFEQRKVFQIWFVLYHHC